jgi:hypothetical protein
VPACLNEIIDTLFNGHLIVIPLTARSAFIDRTLSRFSMWLL